MAEFSFALRVTSNLRAFFVPGSTAGEDSELTGRFFGRDVDGILGWGWRQMKLGGTGGECLEDGFVVGEMLATYRCSAIWFPPSPQTPSIAVHTVKLKVKLLACKIVE
jgi:hypothetical protein